MHTYIHTYIHTCIKTHTHTHTHTHIHTHTYIYIYIYIYIYCNAPAGAEEPLVSLASSCDAPAEAEEPPVQVRWYSWHSYAKHVAYDKRREFVGTNKRTNSNSLLFFQQKPLVSRVHLMMVVRKIGQYERSRGKQVTVNIFEKPFANGGKDVTSSSPPNRTVKGENISCFDTDNSGIGIFNHEYTHVNDKYNSEGSERQEKENEEAHLFPGAPDGKGMIASSISDVTIREAVWEPDVNRLIARKHLVSRKQLLPFSVKSFKEAFKAYNKVVTFVALFLATVTIVLGGLTNIIWYGKKCIFGNSDSLAQSESSRDCSCHYSISILRKVLVNILGFNKKLWLYVIIYSIWKENKPFRNEKEEMCKLRNTWIFRLVIAMSGLRNLQLSNICATFGLLSVNMEKTFLAGKCFRAYLCLFVDLWASCRYYLYIYIYIYIQ